MAISNDELQVTWDTGSNSTTLATVTGEDSDAMTFDQTSIAAQVELKAVHGGTPGAGDNCDFYILYTLGDPDGTGGAEYATTGHGVFLANLDMNTDEPAIAVVPINPCAVGCKIRAYNNAGETITVSATILEKVSS